MYFLYHIRISATFYSPFFSKEALCDASHVMPGKKYLLANTMLLSERRGMTNLSCKKKRAGTREGECKGTEGSKRKSNKGHHKLEMA